jgi:hypothetical protein
MVACDLAGPANARRMRDLLVEFGAPANYYEGIGGETEGQRKRKHRDEAIITLLTERREST